LNLFPSITSGAGRMVISVVRRTPSRPRRSKTSPPSRGPRSDMSGSWESSRYARTANMSRNAASNSSSTATMTGCAAALSTPTRSRSPSARKRVRRIERMSAAWRAEPRVAPSACISWNVAT